MTFRQLSGDDLSTADWDRFHSFRLATIEKKWGGAYLTREFFEAIQASMADKVLLIMAEQDGEPIAGALNFIGSDTLYGRNWGCRRTALPAFRDLLLSGYRCRHQPWAETAGSRRARPCTRQRGCEPVTTWSSHYLYHEGFADAIRRYTAQEAAQLDREAEELRGRMPYRRDGS